ncbi:MAG TPA: hypothetical protein VFS03_09475 [Microvirga sp.]|nr:hypothetical protein [Microvirga sp.]
MLLMRSFLLITLVLMAMGAARAQSAPSALLRDCVPPREMPEVVESNGVVAPATAVITARRQVPNADVVRANLCWNDKSLVYVIVALRKDGRVVHVMIDGPSGRVRSVQ